jgi:Protein of unknown function DUF45
VLVDAPVEASREAILAAVRKRAHWIQLHVAGFLRRCMHALPREYVSGEAVMYLGRRYLLKVIQTDVIELGARLFGSHLEVRSATRSPQEVRAGDGSVVSSACADRSRRANGRHAGGTPMEASAATRAIAGNESPMGKLLTRGTSYPQPVASEGPERLHGLRNPARALPSQGAQPQSAVLQTLGQTHAPLA